MRAATLGLVAVGFLATLAILVATMEVGWANLGFAIGISLWALSPYAGLWVLARRRSPPRGWMGFAFAATVLVAGSTWAYVDAMFVHTDAQSGLLFLFMPFWQWIAVASAMVLAAIVGSRWR